MSEQQVIITYSGPSSFLSSDNWKQVYHALLAQLPLRNVHWKPASHQIIRTVQTLDVTLVPLDTARDELTLQIPVPLLEKSLLNVFFITCEDLEAYRNTAKKQIKDWLSIVSQRRNQEWLVVQVVRPDTRTASSSFFQVKGSVLDKIKGDFNTEKRDRCVQLTWSTGSDNPSIWADLITKMKEGVIYAFDLAVNQREEEVRRSEAQRHMPGWNFCTFFILKESLATSFEGIHLFEDAIIQYDDLESMFFQVLLDKNLSWFGSLITPSADDDSMPLLSATKKPYRDFILANTISIFDFRTYLLARQCNLLAKLGRFADIGQKSSLFLSGFSQRLREIEATLPRHFIESWIYHSACSVVEQSESWAQRWNNQEADLAKFNAVKGELLELAKNQLDILGVKCGHLPVQIPFSMSLPRASLSEIEVSQSQFLETPNESDLRECLGDQEKFYSSYISLTNRAIDMYVKAKRRKFALKLHGSLAALDLHRGHFSSCLQTYASLPAHYAPHMWLALETFVLSKALESHNLLKKMNTAEWIHMVLSYLRAYVDGPYDSPTVGEDRREARMATLLGALKSASDQLESGMHPLLSLLNNSLVNVKTDLVHLDHPAFAIFVSNDSRNADTEDGSFIDVVVENRLPCDVPADKLSITLTGSDDSKLQFSTKTGVISSGKTRLTLFCAVPLHGSYFLDSSELRVSNLLFRWNHKTSAAKKSARGVQMHCSPIRVPYDVRALDVRVRQPYRVELKSQNNILVTLSTGRNRCSSISIKLSSPSKFYFIHSQASLYQCEGTMEKTDDEIHLTDLEEERTLSFLFPYQGDSSHRMKVFVDVQYVASNDTNVIRKLRLIRSVSTSLPIAVNVQDFFRGKRLFSKFTVSTTSHQHIRLLAASLEGPSDLTEVKISGCGYKPALITTITPVRPANFLFHVDSSGPIRDSLQLTIKYRMLREEVESVVRTSISTTLSEMGGSVLIREGLMQIILQALESNASWIDPYDTTGSLVVPRLDDNDASLGAYIPRIKQLLAEHKHSPPLEGSWQEIVIPVDVPLMHIIAAVSLQIPGSLSLPSTNSVPLYAGQPIFATLSVTTSFHWGHKEDRQEQCYSMRYDFEEVTRDWLVSGRKRGDFVAADGTTFTFPITLIALRHGELAPPKVTVRPIPIVGEMKPGSVALPSAESYQVHGGEKVLILPRGGRSTFVIDIFTEVD